MPRRGGLAGGARRLIEAGVERATGVKPSELTETRERLVESLRDARAADANVRRLGFLTLNALRRGLLSGQDDEPQDRIALGEHVRNVSRQNAQMLYAVRLRNAFAFGRGVPEPKANDAEVQDLLKGTWERRANRAELTSPEAQWRFGKDLWELANVYFVVFDDGLDGEVLLGSLQFAQVIREVRDPKVWRRVLYYVVEEWAYEWDFQRHQLKPNPQRRVVYYEALEGMLELEEDLKAGRTELPPRPSQGVRPGRVLHVKINAGKEQAFGEPELRTNVRWASAFNDLLAGQVGKAQAAQQYLMKVTAKGAKTAEQLQDVAMRAVGRRSPLARASLEEPPALEPPTPAGQYPGLPPHNARPGSQFWGSDALDAEPFSLDSGASGARQDMESAAQAFAAGTNYPGHYFFGDPGSLAGSMAVELPVLKLSEVDGRLVEGVFRAVCDRRIARALEVGILTDRRPPTPDEIREGVELGPDGLVDRDLTYTLEMPDPLRRNLPELMQLVVDTATTFDVNGTNEPLTRALVGFTLELLDFPNAGEIVEHYMRAWEQDKESAAAAPPPPAPPPPPAGGGGTGEPPTFTGPDGKQHTSANPYGARQQSDPVVEAALGELWRRLTVAIEDGSLDVAGLAPMNGGSG